MYPGGNSSSSTNYIRGSHPFIDASTSDASSLHDDQEAASSPQLASNYPYALLLSSSSRSNEEQIASGNAYTSYLAQLQPHEILPRFNQQQQELEQQQQHQRLLHHSQLEQAHWVHYAAPYNYPASDHPNYMLNTQAAAAPHEDQHYVTSVMESFPRRQTSGSNFASGREAGLAQFNQQGLNAPMEQGLTYNEQLNMLTSMQASGVEPRSIYDNLNQAFGHAMINPSSSLANAGARYEETCTPRPRWSPTQEQIQILESLFNSGTTTPSRDMIVDIAAQLRQYGSIAEANVFYWFQNRKARAKRKLHAPPPNSSATP